MLLEIAVFGDLCIVCEGEKEQSQTCKLENSGKRKEHNKFVLRNVFKVLSGLGY